jgi:hypothetical protein
LVRRGRVRRRALRHRRPAPRPQVVHCLPGSAGGRGRHSRWADGQAEKVVSGRPGGSGRGLQIWPVERCYLRGLKTSGCKACVYNTSPND